MLHKIDFLGFVIWKILERVISDILFVSLVPGIRAEVGQRITDEFNVRALEI
jgi:hypothetical protein